MAQLLTMALVICGIAFMPPWIAIVYAESPAHGISLFVPGGARQEDLDSFLLSHVAAILTAHAPFKSALCLAAAAYFERQAQQTVAVLLLGLDVCELATQFRYPMSAEIARWPSVDPFLANRHMVPILFAQVMILSLALVLGCADDPRAGGGVRPSRTKSG